MYENDEFDHQSLDELAQDIVSDAMSATFIDSAERSDDPKLSESAHDTIRGFLVERIVDAARSHAEEHELANEDFREIAWDGVEIVDALRHCVRTARDTWDPNFWEHKRKLLDDVRKNHSPDIDYIGTEEVASQYLDLPYRCTEIERLIIDMLIAAETQHYFEEMVMPRSSDLKWLPARSPLHKWHVFPVYLITLIVSGTILLGAAWLLFQTGIGFAEWIGIALMVLYVVLFALSTFSLPFEWVKQSKSRNKVYSIMKKMLSTYSEMNTYGPISAKRLREVIDQGANIGIAWPTSLYAIIDDNLARSGRL